MEVKRKQNTIRSQIQSKADTERAQKKTLFVEPLGNCSKKRQPAKGCRSQSSMYFQAVPDVPDTGNCKRRLGKDCVQLLPHTANMAAYRDMFVAKGFFLSDFFIHLPISRYPPFIGH